MHMTTSTREVAGVIIVDISGRIALGDESAALRDLVRHLLMTLFNLADVKHIDSAGLGHLVGAFTSVQKQAGELKLLRLTNKVHDANYKAVHRLRHHRRRGRTVKSFGKSAGQSDER